MGGLPPDDEYGLAGFPVRRPAIWPQTLLVTGTVETNDAG
jgi:hypothetical protein